MARPGWLDGILSGRTWRLIALLAAALAFLGVRWISPQEQLRALTTASVHTEARIDTLRAEFESHVRSEAGTRAALQRTLSPLLIAQCLDRRNDRRGRRDLALMQIPCDSLLRHAGGPE